MNALGSPRNKEPRLIFKPRFEKIIETLLYITHKKPGRDQYQIVKLFYLSDRKHFNRFGRPITYEIYFALDYGPVASTALDLIKSSKLALRKAKINSLPVRIEKKDNIYFLMEPMRSINYDLFSTSDLLVLDEVISEFGEKSFGELYNLTHSHFAYCSAWNSRGNANRSMIYYEDMLDDGPKKAEIVESLEGISEHMK